MTVNAASSTPQTQTPTTQSSTGSASGSSSSAASAQTSLSGNFDTFLKLLTTQMQNQDPLKPMDSTQFTDQLVQFSGVEQSIKTNQNLEKLISLVSSNNLNNAMGYLGKGIEADIPDTSLKNGSATWNYSLGATSDQTGLQITDSHGRVVYKTAGETGSGPHTFTWDGRDANGNTLPDGVYTLSVAAKTSGGTAIDSSVTLNGTVSDVNIVNGSPVLSVNGVSVDTSKITAIHEPTTQS
ncbi:MAG TPA: flagellar hook capping FlgD N-terminal domain-containing protein [Alphaproteobacteria bacterium]|nr:flagellar hook capping FlgD N-terminal domain-containing protein [Alphaproteobacteria bacterium]